MKTALAVVATQMFTSRMVWKHQTTTLGMGSFRCAPILIPILGVSLLDNVGGYVYNRTIKERLAMLELETELLSLKAELEAENFSGSSEDENPDPRMTRVSEIMTILEVFFWEDWKRIVIANFGVPADHFED